MAVSHRHTLITLLVVNLTGGVAVFAQQSEPAVLLAVLLLPAVPPDWLLTNAPSIPPAPPTVMRHDASITVVRRLSREQAAWARFEQEFRPARRNPSQFKHHLETAKYGLDTTVFAADRFLKEVRDLADFEFDQGRFHRTDQHVRKSSRGNPRVKLDFTTAPSKPYLGLRVVIPF